MADNINTESLDNLEGAEFDAYMDDIVLGNIPTLGAVAESTATDNDDSTGSEETNPTESIDDSAQVDDTEDLEDTKDNDKADLDADTPDSLDGEDTDTAEGDAVNEDLDKTQEDADNSSEDEDAEPSDEDTSDTEISSDGESKDTDGIDYKAFYEQLTNTEIVINGKKTKGLKTPEAILKAQQKAGGFEAKMAGFKQYKPYMKALRDSGLLEDQDKFNLIMDVVGGDEEAIKKLVTDSDIDPLTIDEQDNEYKSKDHVTPESSIILDEVYESARQYGVEDMLDKTLKSDWDAKSIDQFFTDPTVRTGLVQQIYSGQYELVQSKMEEMKRSDNDGVYNDMPMLEMYNVATQIINSERQQDNTSKSKKSVNKTKLAQEKAKIVNSRKKAKYTAKADVAEKEVAEQRKKAASVSKKKTKAPVKVFDPLELEGEEFDKFMDGFLEK